MSIPLEMLNLVIRRSTIEEKYPGGWQQCLADHHHLLDGRVWFDEYLFHDGAMSSEDMKALVETWKNKGLTPYVSNGLRPVAWRDCCVIETLFDSEVTLLCDWIVIEGNEARLKGT